MESFRWYKKEYATRFVYDDPVCNQFAWYKIEHIKEYVSTNYSQYVQIDFEIIIMKYVKIVHWGNIVVKISVW